VLKYKIFFKYMDGETYELDVHPNDMEKLMDALGKNEVYFNDSRGVGVWIPIDKVRYFQVERQDEQGRRVVGSDPKLSSGERETSRTDGSSSAEGVTSLGDVVPSFATPTEFINSNIQIGGE